MKEDYEKGDYSTRLLLYTNLLLNSQPLTIRSPLPIAKISMAPNIIRQKNPNIRDPCLGWHLRHKQILISG